jgi:hypothetical protein
LDHDPAKLDDARVRFVLRHDLKNMSNIHSKYLINSATNNTGIVEKIKKMDRVYTDDNIGRYISIIDLDILRDSDVPSDKVKYFDDIQNVFEVGSRAEILPAKIFDFEVPMIRQPPKKIIRLENIKLELPPPVMPNCDIIDKNDLPKKEFEKWYLGLFK